MCVWEYGGHFDFDFEFVIWKTVTALILSYLLGRSSLWGCGPLSLSFLT